MLKAHHHLTRDQRCQIFALKRRGLTQTGIAVDVGVSQGTVSRELARTPCLIVRVETFLHENQWSPEQIRGALNHEDGTKVSHESLYRHIWSDKRMGGTLY